jgi:hypothetical protein
VLLILELVFIRKIQKQLDEFSLQEFNDFLKKNLQMEKMERLGRSRDSLKFQRIVLLRENDESCDTYEHVLKNNRL